MLRQIALMLALSVAVPIAGAATPLAPAAVLNVDQGTVLVNNGSQFVTAKPGQALKPGDRVMVMSGGAATVKYSNGHTAALPAGTLVSFDSRGFGGYAAGGSPSGTHATRIGPMYAQAVGQGNDDDDNSCKAKCVGWIFGGLALVGVIALTNSNGGDHVDHPVSGR